MQIATIELPIREHSEVGASARERFSKCPGSVRLSRYAPPEVPREYTEDGIEAHAFAEVVLKERDHGQRAVLYATWTNNGGDLEIFRSVVSYSRYFERYASIPGAIYGIEDALDLSWLVEDARGRCDAWVYVPAGFIELETGEVFEGPTLHVFDFKFGKLQRYAKEHPQTLYYASGAFFNLVRTGVQYPKRVVLHIFQPRVENRNRLYEHHDVWSCDLPYLEQDAIKLKDEILATREPDAPLNPGVEQCRFCPAATICPELQKPGYEAAKQAIAEQNSAGAALPALATFEEVMQDDNQKIRAAYLARSWANQVIEQGKEQAFRGQKFADFALFNGNRLRYLSDEAKFREAFPPTLYPDCYEQPIAKSVAQIETVLAAHPFGGKKLVKRLDEEFTRKGYPKPIFGPKEGSRRKEYTGDEKFIEEWSAELADHVHKNPPDTPTETRGPEGQSLQRVIVRHDYSQDHYSEDGKLPDSPAETLIIPPGPPAFTPAPGALDFLKLK